MLALIILIVVLMLASAYTPASEHAIYGAKAARPRTYLLFGDDSTQQRSTMADILNRAGYEPAGRDADFAHIVWFSLLEGMRYPSSRRAIRCDIKNIFDAKSHARISNKFMLHTGALRDRPYLARSIPFSQLRDVGSKVWIIRASGTGYFGGRDVIRVSTNSELRSARKNYNWPESTLASEYIMNPALFDGRKFQIRLYLLLRRKSPRWSLSRHAEIFAARENYVVDKFDDNRIHDTHAGRGKELMYYPADKGHISGEMPDEDEFWRQCDAIARDLADEVGDDLRPYPEAKDAFEVFGLDIMIANNRAYLLEVNARPGHAHPTHGPRHAQFERDNMEWTVREGYQFIDAKN